MTLNYETTNSLECEILCWITEKLVVVERCKDDEITAWH